MKNLNNEVKTVQRVKVVPPSVFALVYTKNFLPQDVVYFSPIEGLVWTQTENLIFWFRYFFFSKFDNKLVTNDGEEYTVIKKNR